MIERLRRDIRTRWFVLNNVNADETEEMPKLNRKDENWEPVKTNGPLKGLLIDSSKH